MKTQQNIESMNLNEMEVTELNTVEVQETEGGLWPLIGVLAAVDAGLWGYIAGKNSCGC